MNYVLSVLIAFDQLVNAIIGGLPDETISARAWRAETNGKVLGRVFRPIIDALFYFIEREHCMKSFIAEYRQSHLPLIYRHGKV